MKKIYLIFGGIIFLVLSILIISAARLPTVDGDSGTWGTVLNEFLNVSHNESGELRPTNLSVTEKITFTLGGIIDNIINGWVQITGGLNVRGAGNFSGTVYINNATDISTWAANVSRNWTLDTYNNWNDDWISTYNATYVAINTTANVQGLLNNTNMLFTNVNVTGYYYGDGSKLTGISATSASWNRSGTEVILHHPTDSVNITGNLIVQGNLTVGDITDNNVTRVRATRNAAQSIPQDTPTVIVWDTETYDNLGEYNTADGKFTATAPGYYSVTASFFSASATWPIDSYWYIWLYKNDATYARGHMSYRDAENTVSYHSTLADIVYLDVGDYITIKIQQNQGAAVNCAASGTSNYFAVTRIRSSITVGALGGVPYGTISPFYLETCPDGWIPADGTSGTPDLRGIFVRGAGTSGTYNMSNGTRFNQAFGIFQNDSFQNFKVQTIIGSHAHSSTVLTVDAGAPGTGESFTYGHYNKGSWGTAGYHTTSSTDLGTKTSGTPITAGAATGTPRVGGETRPASYALTYCMKTSDDSQQTAGLIGTSGNNVFLQNVSKNFGVGTLSPSAKFVVNGTGALLNIKNDSDSFLFVNATSARVGIGTWSPFSGWNVAVSPGLQIEGTTPAIGFHDNAGGGEDWLLLSDLGGIGFYDDSNTSWRMYLDDAGNVGIGTTSPNARLDVEGNVTIQGQLNISGASRIRANTGGTQALPNTASTIIHFNETEDYDNLGEFNGTDFVAKESGYYFIKAAVRTQSIAWDAGERAISYCVRSVGAKVTLDYDEVDAAITKYIHLIGSDVIFIEKGESIHITVYHDQDTTITLDGLPDYNYFSVHRLS